MKPVRIGVVGAGVARGQWWISTVTKMIDHLELVGICEPVRDQHEANRKRWNVPIYGDLLEMIEGAKPEAVLCAVPPDGNPAVAHVAARHGIHVVSEIPVASTPQLARSMQHAATEGGIKLEIAENVHRWPAERLKQKIIAAGLLGDVQLVRLSYITGSYHGFDAVRALVGSRPSRVLGFGRDLKYPFYDDYMRWQLEKQRWAGGMIEFENGVACWYEKPVLGGCGQQFWHVEGSEGNLTMDTLELNKTLEPTRLPFQTSYEEINGVKALNRMWVDTDPCVEFVNPYTKHGVGPADDLDEVARADILARFSEAIRNDTPVAYPPEMAWPDQMLVIAIEESERRGNTWVDVTDDQSLALEDTMHETFRELYGCGVEEIETLIRKPMPRGGVRFKVLGDM